MNNPASEHAVINLFVTDNNSSTALPEFVSDPASYTRINSNQLEDTNLVLPAATICFIDLPAAPLLETFNHTHRLLNDNGIMLLPEQTVQKYHYCIELAQRLGFSLIDTDSDFKRYPTYLTFKKNHHRRWQLSVAQAHHTTAIQSLFLNVFNHPLSDALWHWKYAQHRGIALLAWKEEQLVGHYGAMQRDILIAGRAAKALQIGDVMIKDTERAVFTRKGLFFQTCATFLEHYIGQRAPFAIGYGFPTQRAMAVATKQGLYRQVDSMVEKQWSALDTRASVFSLTKEVTQDNMMSLRHPIDKLWETMRNDFNNSTIGVRDWQYIVHRYIQRPEKTYRIYLVKQRFTTKPLGLVVLAQEDQRCRLMDIVGDVQLFPTLIFHARRLCIQLSATQLYGWITLSHQHHWESDTTKPLDICIPTNAWSDRKRDTQMIPKWWLTAGDTDFC